MELEEYHFKLPLKSFDSYYIKDGLGGRSGECKEKEKENERTGHFKSRKIVLIKEEEVEKTPIETE